VWRKSIAHCKWLTDVGLVGARRRAIRAVNLLDPDQDDFPAVEAELPRTLSLVRQVQDERRRHDR